MKPKAEPAAKGTVDRSGCVCFELTHLAAHETCVAGSFNDWHPAATEFVPNAFGTANAVLTVAATTK